MKRKWKGLYFVQRTTAYRHAQNAYSL